MEWFLTEAHKRVMVLRGPSDAHASAPAPAVDRKAETGGELKIIAALFERPVIEKIPTHLALSPDTDSPVDCLRVPKGPATARARPARLDPQPPPRGRTREVVQE